MTFILIELYNGKAKKVTKAEADELKRGVEATIGDDNIITHRAEEYLLVTLPC